MMKKQAAVLTLSKHVTAALRRLSTLPTTTTTQYHNNKVELGRGISARSIASSVAPYSSHDVQTNSNNSIIKTLARYKSTGSVTTTTTTAAAAAATAAFDQSIHQPFPSIIIGSKNYIQPQGSFAEAQAQFLDPDPQVVETLKHGLLKTNMGIVAHYYMDVELQGVLQALKQSHPDLQHRIGIADSLKMGDLAVQMCQHHGVTSVICLGVDFMSESVQAILHKNQLLRHVPVYRATPQAIGCSLAESAEGTAYRAWLQQESAKATTEGLAPLHVIYINTSLETKAVSSSIVPTITCTSSNVLQTLLQAAHQIPNLRVLYGPDTYMGQNLLRLLEVILESSDWTDQKVASDLHPHHSNETLRRLKDNLVVFPQGNCVVHHMFGSQVVDTVKERYYNEPNTYMTAHLEVPGEMFDIAMTKSLNDEGVVGSTSDILNFITRKVKEATAATSTPPHRDSVPVTDINDGGDRDSTNVPAQRRLRFVLGTEAGMVTSIVKSVQDILDRSVQSSIHDDDDDDDDSNNKNKNSNRTAPPSVEAEIIFPVSSEAIMATDDNDESRGDLAIVPGVAGGEGCSTAGGCATCPFMKMNDLDAVQDIIDMVDEGSHTSSFKLQKHLPPDRLRGKFIDGVDATELGTEGILYMRAFMTGQGLPDELVKKVNSFGKP
ncbi:quinolinate synthetase A protein [Nitzschia inconspicua]|uniref:Quinolinate synthetase A protein n=1 Tax=Nitzschia inconspicua TaxID=303405 RepID=A0A9K3KUZ2_9STRA|nr:quinolinate synthetase A protein [Nitzschia inconspicua]